MFDSNIQKFDFYIFKCSFYLDKFLLFFSGISKSDIFANEVTCNLSISVVLCKHFESKSSETENERFDEKSRIPKQMLPHGVAGLRDDSVSAALDSHNL